MSTSTIREVRVSKADAVRGLQEQIARGRGIAAQLADPGMFQAVALAEAAEKWGAETLEMFDELFGQAGPYRYYLDLRTKYGHTFAEGDDYLEPPAATKQLNEHVEWLEGLVQETRDWRPKKTTRRVFIVHGHDDALSERISTLLRDEGFETTILKKELGRGSALIEKLERHADRSDVAVVLLTPDDEAANRQEEPEVKRRRARQNVILELGYFFGALGRRRAVLVNSDRDLEMPSDIHGMLTLSVQSQDFSLSLVKEVRAAARDRARS